jgi:hypothetical protein
VADLAETLARVRELGGSVIQPDPVLRARRDLWRREAGGRGTTGPATSGPIGSSRRIRSRRRYATPTTGSVVVTLNGVVVYQTGCEAVTLD